MGQRYDPIRNFNFTVDFSWTEMPDGVTNGITFGFQKVSGLKSDVDVVEYREGGDNLTVRKLPGLVKWDPITCEKGVVNSLDLWKAFNILTTIGDEYGTKKNYRGTLTITVKSRSNTTSVRKYVCEKAWVSSYEVGELDAQGNAVLIERVVFQHEGFEVTNS